MASEKQCSGEALLKDEEFDQFVVVANKAVDIASDLLRMYVRKRQPLETFNKKDNNGCIVEQGTVADIAVEELMVKTILQEFPDHVVYGEETGWSSEKEGADFVWVIDPIDGTTSFKNGVPVFGVLLALVYRNKPILGIIDQPVVQRRWLGVHGRRTIDTFYGVTTEAHTSSCEELSRATLYTCSPLHFSDEEQKSFSRVADKVPEPHYGADCLHYGLLASGYIDVVIQSFLGAYDFLAFIPIIQGAGGVITDWKGHELHWEASPSFEGPSYYSIIAAGDVQVHQQALEYLNERA